MTEAYPMTKAQIKALKWFSDHNGIGVIDRYGRILAGGELSAGIKPVTWLRLVLFNYVCGTGSRIMMTGAGDDALAELGRRRSPVTKGRKP